MDNMNVLSAAYEEMHQNSLRLRSRTMKRYGLGISDLACLMTIKTSGGMTSTELSRACRVDKALVSRSIKKLLELNIISYAKPRMPISEAAARIEVKTRRRGAYRVKLILTEYGEEITRRFFDVSLQAAQNATQGISEEEMAAFNTTLQRLNENFRAYMEQLDKEQADEQQPLTAEE